MRPAAKSSRTRSSNIRTRSRAPYICSIRSGPGNTTDILPSSRAGWSANPRTLSTQSVRARAAPAQPRLGSRPPRLTGGGSSGGAASLSPTRIDRGIGGGRRGPLRLKRRFVQHAQSPVLAGTLEHRARPVALAEREQAVERQAEGATQDGPVRPAMRHDRDGAADVGVDDAHERGPCASDQVGNTLALREGELADARGPALVLDGLARADLVRGEPVPSPHRHFPQGR